jgi:FkbM family methyltransferase
LATNERFHHCGVELEVESSALSDNIRTALKKGRYESAEAKEVQRILQYRERVLEVGAGIGFISTLAAKHPNVEAVRVYEANPDLCRIINHNHKLNQVDSVDVFHGVLANGPSLDKVDFYLRRDFWASSLSPKPWGYNDVVPVPQYSFAEAVETFAPTVIICDIEGGELDLFQNCNLRGVEKVLVEVHQQVLGRPGMKALFDAFQARDFHYDQHHSHGSVVMFSHIKRDEMRKQREDADRASVVSQ